MKTALDKPIKIGSAQLDRLVRLSPHGGDGGFAALIKKISSDVYAVG